MKVRPQTRRTILACTVTAVGLTVMVHAKAGTRTAATMPLNVDGPAVTTDGPPIAVAHGIVQVQVTVTGKKITGITVLRLPHDNDTSYAVSERAAGILRSEVLSAQSTAVDAVSGATYTSAAYLQSIQAAIDTIHDS